MYAPIRSHTCSEYTRMKNDISMFSFFAKCFVATLFLSFHILGGRALTIDRFRNTATSPDQKVLLWSDQFHAYTSRHLSTVSIHQILVGSILCTRVYADTSQSQSKHAGLKTLPVLLQNCALLVISTTLAITVQHCRRVFFSLTARCTSHVCVSRARLFILSPQCILVTTLVSSSTIKLQLRSISP